jgi:hypothetical protein
MSQPCMAWKREVCVSTMPIACYDNDNACLSERMLTPLSSVSTQQGCSRQPCKYFYRQ